MNGFLVPQLGHPFAFGLPGPVPMGTSVPADDAPIPDPPLPADMGDAIEAIVRGDGDLVDGFSGGIFRDRPQGDIAGPYLVYRVNSSRPALATDTSDCLDMRVQFASYAASAADAVALRALIVGRFNRAQVDFRGGSTTPFRLANKSDDEVPKTIAGRQTSGGYPFRATVEFSAMEEIDRP